jgi:hypothetical protein
MQLPWLCEVRFDIQIRFLFLPLILQSFGAIAIKIEYNGDRCLATGDMKTPSGIGHLCSQLDSTNIVNSLFCHQIHGFSFGIMLANLRLC